VLWFKVSRVFKQTQAIRGRHLNISFSIHCTYGNSSLGIIT